ncbi:unnamed protein product [Cuscuta epithymum]|uniref:Formin-like protein 18 n=1 Tax=Cuscuta epithymum TaxID=186058 RepID=A0AAV0DQ50_9ASTE|nr:unnamed protein product [Cuscuta epithymum]CAH9125728.1 unnamed protein product [Cuscuta epithymum]
MDPCPFVRINIGNLALKFPSQSKPPPADSCYCKFKLCGGGFATQFSTVPVIHGESDAAVESRIHTCYTLKKSDLEKLNGKGRATCSLKIDVFSERGAVGCALLKGAKRLGGAVVNLDLKTIASAVSSRGVLFQNGWVAIGGSTAAQLHVNVQSEPDPRFVFQFDGEPECSPQVFQVNGNVKQPVFSCKFGLRSGGDWNLRSRSSLSEQSTSTSCFSGSGENGKPIKERKGWSITIHDLSGSPVAAASMVTPFVPSPGSDRVSRSNPGAWLILRPGQGTWKPWGRLEAWRECGAGDSLGCRFELIPDGITDTVTLANSTINMKTGGCFSIDIMNGPTPLTSPSSSFDFSSGSWSGTGSDIGSNHGSGSWAHLFYRGFVMSAGMGGDGKCGKTEVEVGVQHVTCAEDAAAFVALAAALDLSMDACRPFSQKLRKELRHSDQES